MSVAQHKSPSLEANDLKDGHDAHSSSHASHSVEVIDSLAEKRLVRKQDLLILPSLALAYLLVFIDRTNLGNARVAGLERSLNLQLYDFNIGACLYYIIYLFMEIPASLIIKKTGFWIVPASTFAFGVITLATAFIQNRGGFFAMRILLGLTECFTMPANAYLLSRYYRRHELATRIASFMLLAAGISQSFAGLLSSGFLSVPPVGTFDSAWRNIFLGEGIITMGIAITMFFFYPADPSKTRIFNNAERALWEQRFKIDQPAITEHKEEAQFSLIKRAMSSPITLTMTWIYITNNMIVQGLSIFTATILRSIYPQRTTVQIQLYSVPPAVVGTVFALSMSYIAMRTRRYAYSIVFCLIFAVIGYSLWIEYPTTPKVRFAALFLVQMAGFGYGPIVLSWAVANASPDTIRAVTAATVVGIGSIGSIASTWTYVQTDAQSGYRIGNLSNVAVASSGVIATLILMFVMKWENKQRQAGKRDDRLSGPNVHLLGNRHPEYRYLY